MTLFFAAAIAAFLVLAYFGAPLLAWTIAGGALLAYLSDAAAFVAVHQGARLPRHDHPEEVRRPRLQRARALDGGDEAFHALERGGDQRHGAELARAGRAAAPLRHRCAERLLPPAPCEGPRDSVFRAD